MRARRDLKRSIFLSVFLCVPLFLFIVDAGATEPGISKEKHVGTVGSRLVPSERGLSLKDCLNTALKENPLLSEAQMGIQAAQKGIESAAGRHFPKLSLDGNYTKRQDPWPYIPAQSAAILPHFSDEFAYWQAVMTIPIYQGGQIVNGVKLADIRKSMQEENYRLSRNEVLANVVNTYNKILQLRELQAASLSSVAALEQQLRNARLMTNAGRTAKVDLLKVEVQLANERQRLLSIDEGLSNSLETLQYLMGKRQPVVSTEMSLSDPLVMSDFLPPVFDQAMETGKQNRPEYLLAEKNLQEAGVSRSISKGKLLPTVAGFGGYIDQYGFNPWYGEANWFTGVNVSIPIFEKSLYADIARDAVLEKKAGERLRAVQDRVRLDILSALSSLRESRNRVLTSGKATEQAKESFRIEELRYQSGAGAVVDMLLAQAAYMTAVANHSQSLFDYNAALVAYRKATGMMEDFLK
ncbi:MAG TPA: TolC family protein [Syntrophales bacterium]|nr:TolC family protein [Syntrophales bacterium]